jgi:hypothetical protein
MSERVHLFFTSFFSSRESFFIADAWQFSGSGRCGEGSFDHGLGWFGSARGPRGSFSAPLKRHTGVGDDGSDTGDGVFQPKGEPWAEEAREGITLGAEICNVCHAASIIATQVLSS